MNYEKMMEDSAAYIEQHIRENLTAQNLSRIYSCTAGYFSSVPIWCWLAEVPLLWRMPKRRQKK